MHNSIHTVLPVPIAAASGRVIRVSVLIFTIYLAQTNQYSVKVHNRFKLNLRSAVHPISHSHGRNRVVSTTDLYQATATAQRRNRQLPNTKMIRSPPKSSSNPDLSAIAEESFINYRKRKQPESDDCLSKKLDDFMHRMEKSIDGINYNINEIIKSELNTLTTTTNALKIELNAIREDNSELKRTVAAMSTQQSDTAAIVAELQTSIEYTSQRVDGIQKQVDVANLRQKSEAELSAELLTVKNTLHNMQQESNKQQQRDRLLNLELTGLPENSKENLLSLFQSIAKYAGVDTSDHDVVHITRVQSRQPVSGRPRTVVVKLTQRIQKDNILAGIRKKHGITTENLNIPGAPKPIYVNEQLTSYNKSLLKQCKDFAKLNMYQFVWVKNCKIYMRKNDKSPPFLITTEADIKKIHKS